MQRTTDRLSEGPDGPLSGKMPPRTGVPGINHFRLKSFDFRASSVVPSGPCVCRDARRPPGARQVSRWPFRPRPRSPHPSPLRALRAGPAQAASGFSRPPASLPAASLPGDRPPQEGRHPGLRAPDATLRLCWALDSEGGRLLGAGGTVPAVSCQVCGGCPSPVCCPSDTLLPTPPPPSRQRQGLGGGRREGGFVVLHVVPKPLAAHSGRRVQGQFLLCRHSPGVGASWERRQGRCELSAWLWSCSGSRAVGSSEPRALIPGRTPHLHVCSAD